MYLAGVMVRLGVSATTESTKFARKSPGDGAVVVGDAHVAVATTIVALSLTVVLDRGIC